MSAGDASPSISGSGNSESELHLKNLEDLCRICFRIINSACYEVKDFSEDLDAAFRANCTTDKPDVHPKRFCLHCYAGMKHFKVRNSIPSYLAVTWKPHAINCSTCETLCEKSKDGRPKKRSRNTGRPKSHVNMDDVMKLHANSPIPKKYLQAASHNFVTGEAVEQ